MRTIKQLAISIFAIGCCLVVCMFLKYHSDEMLLKNRNQLKYKMRLIGLVAKRTLVAEGQLPQRIDYSAVRELAHQENVNYMNKELELPIQSWLVCAFEPDEVSALNCASKLPSNHVLYCLVKTETKDGGFRIFGKDSSGAFIEVHGHNPLILTEKYF